MRFVPVGIGPSVQPAWAVQGSPQGLGLGGGFDFGLGLEPGPGLGSGFSFADAARRLLLPA